MKKQIYLLFLWLLFQAIDASAQSLTINGPSTPIQMCGSQTYTLSLSAGNLNGNVAIASPEPSITLTGPTLISVSNNVYTFSANGASMTFTVNVGCHFTDNFTSANSAVVTRVNSIVYTPTVGSAISTTQNFGVTFFYLLHQTSSTFNTNLTATQKFGSTFTRKFEIYNSGPLAYAGPIDITDNQSGSTIQINSIEILLLEKSTGNQNTLKVVYNTNTLNYQWAFPKKIDSNYSLIVVETLTVNACLDQASSSTINIRYGCDNQTLCHDAGTTLPGITVSKDAGIHQITVTRTSPTILNERTCPGAVTNFTFEIENTGDINLSNIIIDLFKQNSASFYYVDQASVVFQSNGNTYTEIENPLTGAIPGCVTNPIDEHKWTLQNLNAGQKVVVSFNMTYCCPPQNTGFNNNLYFNTWQLVVESYDECSHLLALEGTANLCVRKGSPSTYSAGWAIGTTPLLNIATNFEPTVTDLTDWDRQPTCDLSAKEEFELDYKKISDQGEFFFCPTLNATPAAEIVVEFILEQGLTLEPNAATDLYLSDGTSLVNFTGAVVTTSGIISPGNRQATSFKVRFPVATPQFPTFESFKRFFESSILHFKMSPCCPTIYSNPSYWIRTYLNRSVGNNLCSSACMLPLSENTNFILVHCPGCTTPGIIVTSTNVTRQTYGYNDADNDGLADLPLTILDPSNSNVKKTRSITGDVINVHSTANFFGGLQGTTAEPGFTLSQWNAVYNPLYYADYLHLEQNIQHSNSGELKFGFVSGTIKLKRAGGITCLQNSPSEVSATILSSDLSQTGDKYCLIVPASKFDGCIHYEAEDKFEIDIQFTVCGNFQPPYPETVPDASKAKKEIDISTVMYISANSSAPCLLWSDPTVKTAQDYMGTITGVDKSNPAFYPINSVIFNCENSGGRHYFYATEYLNYVDWKANNNVSCQKTLTNVSVVRMGGGANNIFPFEVRPPAILDRIQINIPNGYTIDHYATAGQNTLSRFPYYYNDPTTQIKQIAYYSIFSNIDMPTLPYTGGSPFFAPAGSNFSLANNYDLVTEAATLPQSYLYPVANLFNTGKMMIGDEYIEQETSVVLKPNCSFFSSNNSSFTMTTLQNLFTINPCAPSTYTKDGVGYIYFPMSSPGVYTLKNPEPKLVLDDLSSPVQAVGLTQSWQFNFKDTSNTYPAENPYIFIPYDPHFTFTSATQSGITLTTYVTGGNNPNTFIYLNGPIAPNSSVPIVINGNYTCSNSNNVYPITIKYGWNCNEKPTDISTVCNQSTKIISLYENGSDIIATSNKIKIAGTNTIPTTYMLCQTYDVSSAFRNIYNGGMYNLIFMVTLPSGLTPAQPISASQFAATISLNGGAITNCTLQYISPNYYKVDLSGSGYSNLWGNAGWHGDIELKFQVTPGCNYSGTPLSIVALGENYCHSTKTTSSIQTQSWSYGGTQCGGNCCSATPVFTIVPQCRCNKFKFTNTSTVSPGNLTMQYLWNFGDGTSSTTKIPQHVYNSNGTFTITLTVKAMSGNTIMCTSTTSQTVVVNCGCHRVSAHFDANNLDGECAWEFRDASTIEEEGTVAYHWEINDEPLYIYDGGPTFRVDLPQQGDYIIYEDVTLTRPDGTTCQSTYSYDLTLGRCEQNCNIPNNITLINDCRQLSLYAPAMWCGQDAESQIVWTVEGVDYTQDGDNPIILDINQSDYNICLSYVCRSLRGDELCNIRFCYAITITNDCQLYIDGNSITDPIIAHRNANQSSRADKQFDVVPNPSNGSRYELKVPAGIASDEKYTVTIFSATGVIEFTREFTGNTSRQITPQLGEGVHTIVISGKDFSTEKKLIVVQ